MFAHLHNHSHYSLLDGLSTPQQLVDRAVAIGQPALALTDHGTMAGIIDFHQAATKQGIKPIVGCEVYITDDIHGKDRTLYHLTLLAMNETGMKNLMMLSSLSYQYYYYKPRIDIHTLAQYSEGIIATTGCMGAPIPRALGMGDAQTADSLMGIFLDIYGKDRFFIELQEHSGIPELGAINSSLVAMAKRFNLQGNFLATNDAHYAAPTDAVPHDMFLCVQTGKKVDDPNRMRFSDAEYYLKTEQEMAQMFGNIPGALSNTMRITEMCNVEVDYSNKMPSPYENPVGMLRHVVLDESLTDEQHERAMHELEIIEDMGFSSYFLIIKEICDEARKRGIWWNTRGSAAGSLVAQQCGITQIDPIGNGLIFERFLNPTRVNMPDIDLDFQDDRRDEIVAATLEMFGSEKFAQIATFGTFGGRSSIRYAAKVLGIDNDTADMIAKNIDGLQSNETTAMQSVDPQHDFFSERNYELYTKDPNIRELFEMADDLQGKNKHAGVHACGVVMTNDDIRNHIPTMRQPKGVAGLGGIEQVTQWPMKHVDALDFLKIDFLGLKTISVMRHACRLIEQNHGVVYHMGNIPYESHHVGPDPSKKATAIFELLQQGDVAGVFQVEGAGMENLMVEMQPYDFQHIVAAVALFRPGPMDNIPMYIARMHGEKFEYAHPDLEPILGDTFGVMVFQEQIMEVAVKIAGYEPGEADKIRKAVGKKIKKDLDMHRDKFITGCVSNGYSLEIGESIWADIEFFARYGFNRAHAASYAMITCMTAFLKAHYRDEYLTALLTNESKDTEKISQYASRMQLDIVQPNVQLGNVDFMIHDGKIVFGLGSVKGTQLNILRQLADAAPFDSLDDLARRVDLSKGKKTLEALIYSGAMDTFGSRTGMIRIVPTITGESKQVSKGQMSLFGHGNINSIVAPDMEDDKMHTALMQKQVTGIFFDHPAREHYTGIAVADLLAFGDEQDTYMLACMIEEANLRVSKKGNKYIIGTLTDHTGGITFMGFGEHRDMLNAMYEDDPNAIYILGVRISSWNNQKKVIINSIRRL